MKIVVLDGYTLNPGDLSWDLFEALGELTVYDRTPMDSTTILNNIGDAEIVFTNKTPLNENTISRAPNVKYIGVLATGYNVVDIISARKQNITVTNIPAYSTLAVAQFTMALLLEMCHHIGDHATAVSNGAWSNCPDFSFWNSPLIELNGKTLGIIGFGNIGQATAKIAQAFGLKVITYSRTIQPENETVNCKYVSLDELLNNSDIISLHCPLNEDTKGIINKSNIEKMKDGVMLINTSRGPLIIEEDLKDALNSNKISGAGIDVVSMEPILPNNPLLKAKNCIITPHIAWAPKEARKRLVNTAIKNLESFLKGEPINVVN
ncbi:D-2-hydroxyacid dehydrogenase [Algibacter mikhailovii]|uniref:Glycerate dehydrogenase n=1 Tax=Algibacter mikhailovii TaxID=425498 RepID=A0A918RBF4_9FLAO|nr:D-2-hydroxyacid dehydrogenase [Algibacter mikhailovii]GGZ92776.1 glycerate dehydrogenase [Algibacter mikhailovii]